jgi:hypothetical protein
MVSLANQAGTANLSRFAGRAVAQILWREGINGGTNGGGEIRTHGTLAGPPVFKTGAFGHSATPPESDETLALPGKRVKSSGITGAFARGGGIAFWFHATPPGSVDFSAARGSSGDVNWLRPALRAPLRRGAEVVAAAGAEARR